MRLTTALTILCALIAFSLADGASQVPDPKIGMAAVQKAFQLDGDCWQFQVYPVDNFGVGTAYDFKPGQPLNASDFICATFGCLATDRRDVGTDAWLNVNGLVEQGGGGSLTMKSDSKSTFGTGIVLPGILKLIKADFNADFTKDVTVEITIPKGVRRLLPRSTFVTQLGKLPDNDPLRQSFRNGTVDYVIGDLVVTSMNMKITVKKTKNITADATLTAAKAFLDKDASAKMKMTGDSTGNYTLDVGKPVILAYCHRRQPGAGQSGQKPGWDDWPVEHTPAPYKQ